MKYGKKILTVTMVGILSAGMLFAASAGKEYESFIKGLEAGDADKAVSSYERFMTEKDRDLESLYKQLDKAMRKDNSRLYYETLEEIRHLDALSITREESDELLSLIVNTSGDDMLDKAAWLYDVSPYYQPVLRFEYSVERPGYRSSGSRSFGMKPGSEVTLPTQETIKARTSESGVLKGWGLAPGRVTYLPGETIVMPATSQTLYAVWENGVSFRDERSGIDEYTADVEAGDIIGLPAVPEVTGQFIFEGWWDPSTGEYIAPDETEYEVRGSGASFEALYLALEVRDPVTSPYTALPRGTQVGLSFDVVNSGNEKIDGIKVTLSSEDPDLMFLGDTFSFRSIPEGRTGRVNASVIYDGTESGKDVPVDVTLEDRSGNVWHGAFTLRTK